MACNEDLALDQRDNVVRRSCINTRRRANIVIHTNTALYKTSSEKNEYFLKDVFACFLQGGGGGGGGEYKVDLQRLHEVEEVTSPPNNGPFALFLGVNVSRYQL